jgi:hypothetical protein
MGLFEKGFGYEASNGDVISAKVGDFDVRAGIHHDQDMGAPWKEHDGHGKVREVSHDWGNLPKRPGERLLWSERGWALLYDWAGACQTAREEGWRPKFCPPGATRRQLAALAVQEDFNHLRGWANDSWIWVGVEVNVFSKQGIQLTKDWAHAIWGIESTAGEYLTEVAEELAVDALAAAKERVEALYQEVFGGKTDRNLHP